eukprot:5846236-Prymnesium_polylepis.2
MTADAPHNAQGALAGIASSRNKRNTNALCSAAPWPTAEAGAPETGGESESERPEQVRVRPARCGAAVRDAPALQFKRRAPPAPPAAARAVEARAQGGREERGPIGAVTVISKRQNQTKLKPYDR